MTTATHPSKYLVRSYLLRRSHAHTPPPAPEDIRRQLGWGLLPGEDKGNPPGRA